VREAHHQPRQTEGQLVPAGLLGMERLAIGAGKIGHGGMLGDLR
jgi:hypothetical protein